jgi:C1A family cysteine protease
MKKNFKAGWIRDIADARDAAPDKVKHGTHHQKRMNVAKHFQSSKAIDPQSEIPSRQIDLVEYCSPIDDQLSLGSCTANAGAGLMEYYEKRAFNTYTEASRLFLYKVTRNLLGWQGDTGAYLRTTMKAMALFGTLPEGHYPYDISVFDREPTAFDYAFAQNYQGLSYFRLDQPDLTKTAVLGRVKKYLAFGYPSMFGFDVYDFGNSKGEIRYPNPTDQYYGGHAVVAIGYDDDRQIENEKGALMIRNSWGKDWGDNGYGWLPYKYVTTGMAQDFWSLFRQEYIVIGCFD